MSIAELLVIAVVALLVLRREHLATLAQTLAKVMQQAQGVRQLFEQRMDEQLKQAQLQNNLARAEEAERNEKNN